MTRNTNRKMAGLGLVVFLATTGLAAAGANFYRISRVEAFDTDIWTVWTSAGDTRVVVDGDGDTDLDCFVYDLSGRLLGKDDDYTDYCIVDFSRGYSGRVKIHIENLGDVWNEYEISVR